MTVRLLQGDCRMVMATLPEASVDAIVTDPPYELTSARPGGRSEATRGAVMGGFMGMKWDGTGVAFDVETWRQALRVLKPGGHLLAFSGTRTYHRMVCAIEDAGFEIRDQIGWVYGSGFPKSRNIAEADMSGDDATRWAGWGTALKPAWEPIVVARKPLAGTVAANVLQHGTGALNIDGCRVEGVVTTNPARRGAGNISTNGHKGQEDTGLERVSDAGRWPANVIHDGSDEVLAAFPGGEARFFKEAKWLPNESSAPHAKCAGNLCASCATPTAGAAAGTKTSDSKSEASRVTPGSTTSCANCTQHLSRADAGSLGSTGTMPTTGTCLPSNGCAQLAIDENINSESTGRAGVDSAPEAAMRFRYCPKASKADRGEGNTHPTVKPTDLMRYLCRLVTPPGGVVLDPFLGSGSTGKAAVLEGFGFIGYDLSAEYIAIARQRIEGLEAAPPSVAQPEKPQKLAPAAQPLLPIDLFA